MLRSEITAAVPVNNRENTGTRHIATHKRRYREGRTRGAERAIRPPFSGQTRRFGTAAPSKRPLRCAKTSPNSRMLPKGLSPIPFGEGACKVRDVPVEWGNESWG